MDNKDLDIIQVLTDKRAFHLDQVKRINIALRALKGEAEELGGKKILPKRIGWTREIETVFDECQASLAPIDVRNKLAEKGITQALEDANKSTIYATLSRLMGNGKLIRAEEGKYRKKGIPVDDIPL